jgi:hypothetical protein
MEPATAEPNRASFPHYHVHICERWSRSKWKYVSFAKKVARGNAAESIVLFELLDEEFDAGAVVVEAPEIERLQGHIGDQDLVVISAQLEQRQLLGRLLRLRRLPLASSARVTLRVS